MRALLFATSCFSFMVFLAEVKSQDDPAKVGIEKAKATYVKEITTYQADIGTYLDKREEAARKDGNMKLLDQIKKDREAFEEKGTLPATAPLALRQKPVTARTALAQSYTVAVKDYIKAKKDDEAATAEKELFAIKRIGGKLPATVIELEDRISKETQTIAKIAGKWLDGTPRGNVIVFKFNGTCEEYLSTGKLNTTGFWDLDADGSLTANLKNGIRFVGKLPDGDTMPIDVVEIASGKVIFTLPFKRAEK